ncbi:MAG: type II toxin-antitoxin system HicB family antitoxin [Acidobacteria bacterium]|jgi:predicted RNase H-like HicB family nuclease|nr:type II toxin-antitoxin system HicB family antitoxin [Acidobacteriota bacterium]
MRLSIRVEIFKEDDVYVALSPELNVSSFGETIYEAKESIKEAIELFLEECREMGTLNEVLEESGFLKMEDANKASKKQNCWALAAESLDREMM